MGVFLSFKVIYNIHGRLQKTVSLPECSIMDLPLILDSKSASVMKVGYTVMTQKTQDPIMEHLPGKKSKLLPIIIIIIIAVVLLLAGVVAVLLQFSYKQEEAVHHDKITALMDVTDKTGEVFSVIETIYLPVTDMVDRELKTGKHATEEDVTELLNNIASPVMGEQVFALLIDRRGNYYCSDGSKGHWTDVSSVLEATENNNIYIGTIPSQGADKQYIFFIKETDIKLDAMKQPVRYILVAMNVEALSERLEVTSFAGKGYTYIIRNDGRVIFRSRTGREPIKGYNVLKGLEDAEFNRDDSLEKLTEALANGTNTAVSFKYDGKEYYVANQSVLTEGWSILNFVESDALGAGMDVMRAETLKYISLVAAGVLIIILLLVFALTWSARTRDKQERERVKSLNEQLKRAAEAANSANQAKTSFLSNMSHDIRTPINGIMGMTAIAMKVQNNPPRTQDCLHKISSASNHLLSLINDVLDMSRIEQNRIVIAKEPVNLKTLLSDCGTIIRGQLNGRSVQYREIWPEELDGHVLGDELHLRQIFINILGNAVKFTPDGGTITAAAEKMAEHNGKLYFRFSFTDTGIGMKPEYIPKIFDAFSQEDNGSRTKYKGTGLGMAITKQFTELMGGTISVTSELNKGTCFTVEIPFEPDPDALKREEAAEEQQVSIRGLRIMLVEDNELNMEIGTELLEDEGAIVFPETDGGQALEAFRAHAPGTYDVILMDIMMPVMDGYETTKAIRSLPDRPDAKTVPIMAMSANAFEEDIQKSLSVGMNDHLSKPIELPKLLNALSRYSKKNK
ncbi:MAG: hypothetical protein CW338_11995 [Clostridiales bacterium]|nr:hypothetical protein [Clostridiales bacterium]